MMKRHQNKLDIYETHRELNDNDMRSQIRHIYRPNKISLLGYKHYNGIYRLTFRSWYCFSNKTPLVVRVVDSSHDSEHVVFERLINSPHYNLMRYIGRSVVGSNIHYQYEYLNGLTLQHYLINHQITKDLFLQLIRGLKHLHSLNLIHCDLKPYNIIIINYNTEYPCLKIIDYDLVQDLGNKSTISLDRIIGTISYLAPESYHIHLYGKHSDVWSLGILLYFMITGTIPFDTLVPNDGTTCIKRSSGYNDIELSKLEGHKTYNLVKSMLTYRYQERISLEDIENIVLAYDSDEVTI